MILSVAREDGLVIYGSLEGRCAEGTSCALNEEDHLTIVVFDRRMVKNL